MKQWRADHDADGPVRDGKHPSKHGLVVRGDNVTAYGLFVEHFLEDNTVWHGENGAIYFYQNELPCAHCDTAPTKETACR